jgi:hypothetical protein
MNRYGQNIIWGTVAAPRLFSGICTSYSYREHLQRQLDEDEAGDHRVLIQHSRKAEIAFNAKVTADSTDFLDLSTGGAISVSGISTGAVLVNRAVERWALGQPKTASIRAVHYPDITGVSEDIGNLDAFTPSQSLGFLFPSSMIKYGTAGLSSGAGVVHRLEITQELTLSEDEPSPDGKILGCASHGYLRTIAMEVLTRIDTDTVPAVGNVLSITGGPDHAAHMRIESIETRFAEKRGKMISFTAVWIPGMTATS